MSTPHGAATSKAPAEASLCSSASPEPPRTSKAPIRGTLCSFEHPRDPGEAELRRLAERQHGCLHRRQLLAGGLGRHAISGRVARGQLDPLHRDVFRDARIPAGPRTPAMAAALHFRGDAVVAGASAAAIWGLVNEMPDTVSVLLAGRSARAQPGIALHRVSAVPREDRRWRAGVPVTSPARAFLDLVAETSLPQAESALAMLRRLELASEADLDRTLQRLPENHRGIALARRLLALPPGELVLTRSVYERRLRKLLRAAELPQPVSNLPVAGIERDLVWPEQRLIVEFDGWIWHRDRFREDRARDAKAVAAGYRVIRLTADRIDDAPLTVIAELAAALAALG